MQAPQAPQAQACKRDYRMAPVALAAAFLLAGVVEGFCPAGFGQENSFPEEWHIPAWPQNMEPEVAMSLRVVTLGGFQMESINEEYLEGPTFDFMVQGRESYWQANGEYFMYYCAQYQKWRIAGISAFGSNKEGACFSFVSDLHMGREVQNTSLIKGWIEVVSGEWVIQEDAGVVKLGTLREQLEAAEAAEAAEKKAQEDCDAEGLEGANGAPAFGEKKTRCPAKIAVNKAKEGLVALGKWILKLFPKFLAAPEEPATPEKAEAEVEAAAAADAPEASGAEETKEQEL